MINSLSKLFVACFQLISTFCRLLTVFGCLSYYNNNNSNSNRNTISSSNSSTSISLNGIKMTHSNGVKHHHLNINNNHITNGKSHSTSTANAKVPNATTTKESVFQNGIPCSCSSLKNGNLKHIKNNEDIDQDHHKVTTSIIPTLTAIDHQQKHYHNNNNNYKNIHCNNQLNGHCSHNSDFLLQQQQSSIFLHHQQKQNHHHQYNQDQHSKATTTNVRPKCPLYMILCNYICHGTLFLFGYLNDILREWGLLERFERVERNREGYTKLYSSFATFYIRNIIQRLINMWCHPVSSVPGAVINILERSYGPYNASWKLVSVNVHVIMT